MQAYRYVNKKYRFSLLFPLDWKRNCFLTFEDCLDDAEASINVNLRYQQEIQGETSTNVFSIIVFNLSKREWEEEYGDSPFQFLGESGPRVFASITPGEPPEEFLKPDKSDYDRTIREFRYLTEMINDDYPKILKTFRLL